MGKPKALFSLALLIIFIWRKVVAGNRGPRPPIQVKTRVLVYENKVDRFAQINSTPAGSDRVALTRRVGAAGLSKLFKMEKHWFG